MKYNLAKILSSKIFYQITVWFLIIGLIPLTSITYLTYNNDREIIASQIKSNLEVIAQHKVIRINEYIYSKLREAKFMSMNSTIVEYFSTLEKAASSEGILSKNYQKTENIIRPITEDFIKYHEYYDFFLISKKGDIIYTVAKENDLDKNLYDTDFINSGLMNVFKNALLRKEPKVSDYKFYEPSNAEAAFIAVPVLKNNQIIGVMAVQINIVELFKIIKDYTGLGLTGEVVTGVLRDNKPIFTTPLRYHSEKEKPIENYATPIPLLRAIRGERGIVVDHDYREKEVLAFLTEIPSLNWFMVVKIDIDEVFSPLERQTRFVFFLFFLIGFIILFLSYRVSRTLTRPLYMLTQAAKNLAEDRNHGQIFVDSENEIGILANTFNEMSSKIKNNIEEIELQASTLNVQRSEIENLNLNLEKKIKEQTEELRKSRDQLTALLDNTEAVIFIKDIEGKYLLINKQYEKLFHVANEWVIGKTDNDIFSLEIAQDLQKNDKTVLEEGKSSSFEEVLPIDNKLYQYLSLKFPLFKPDGSVYALCSISTDITERKKIERNLKRERDFSTAIVDSAGTIIVVLKPDGKIIRINKTAEKISGYQQEEIINKNIFDLFILEKEKSIVKKNFDNLLKIKNTVEFESYWLTKQKEKICVSWAGTSIRDENEKSSNIICIGVDITEKKKLEKEINRTQESLTRAQNIAHIGNWDWNIITNTLWWSDEIYQIFEIEPKFFSPKYETFLEFIHPDDRERLKSAVKAALEQDIPYSIDHRVKLINDKEKIVHEMGEVIRDQTGKPLRMIGTVQDITELRQIQKKLEDSYITMTRYLEIINQNVLVTTIDEHGTILSASEALCNISDYKQEELIGQNHIVLIHPDVHKETLVEIRKTLEKDTIWHGELKNITKEGEIFWTDVVITPNLNNDNKTKEYTIIRQDITDKKKVEELSITDELTGLFNRRYFNDISDRELRRAKREKSVVTFIMIDIDHFKLYNDTYGHQKGDKVLEKVGSVMRKTALRAGDYAFRLGGEEFAFLLLNSAPEQIEFFSKKLKDDIASLKIEHQKNSASKYVTISIGTAKINDKYDLDEMIMRADKALYQAKDKGRNRVVFG
ncbi:MAG: PAS domain S-box protein [Spirochaetia bacterium]|nr:PAS domain S-box protein [Spirochaetia bacterium]